MPSISEDGPEDWCWTDAHALALSPWIICMPRWYLDLCFYYHRFCIL